MGSLWHSLVAGSPCTLPRYKYPATMRIDLAHKKLKPENLDHLLDALKAVGKVVDCPFQFWVRLVHCHWEVVKEIISLLWRPSPPPLLKVEPSLLPGSVRPRQ